MKNEDKKDISLLDYSCLLARMYALIIGQNVKIPGGNPFKEQLKAELQSIYEFLDKHKIREDDVIQHVRKLVPATDWDRDIRDVFEEAKGLLSLDSTDEKKILETLAKLSSIQKPDYKDRLALEKLIKDISDTCE